MLSRQMRVGVVEDNALVSDSVARLLQAQHMDVACYKSAEELLNSGEALRLDCLVVDLQLPGMDGCRLVEEMRARGINIPVVLTSGLSTADLSHSTSHLSRITIVSKPCEPQIFIDAVRASTG
jgi:FixJ family two-component response regulator